MRKHARNPVVEGLEERLALSCAGQVISATVRAYNAFFPTPFGTLNATFAKPGGPGGGGSAYGAGSAEFAQTDWCEILGT